MSETSHLTGEIPLELLDESGRWSIVFSDQNGEDRVIDGISLENPYEFDVSQFLPNKVPLTLPGFFTVASELIQDAQARSGVESSKRVELVEEYNPEFLSNRTDNGKEVITYRVLSRKPAEMAPSGKERPQRGARPSYDFSSPDQSNRVIRVNARPIDHMIEFSCWAKTNRLANSRALWLEKLFTSHAWAFRVKGADKFLWENRGADTYLSHGQQRLFYRPLNFMLRTQEFEVVTYPVLSHINFEVSIRRS